MNDPAEYADDQYSRYLYDLDLKSRANEELAIIYNTATQGEEQ